MTTYDFEAATGAMTAANTGGATGTTSGTNNTATIDNVQVISGSTALKIQHGNPVGPVNPTNVCIIDYWATGAAGGSGTTFGTAADKLTSGMTCFYVPVGGFAASTGGYSTIRQWYGTSTGTTVTLRMRVKDKVATVAALEFFDGTNVAVILTDLTPYEGTWVAVRHQIDTGTTASNGAVNGRFYATPYDAVGTYVGTQVAVTTWNLGSITTTTWPTTRFRIGQVTLQAAPVTMWMDYIVETPGSLAWVTGPTAPSAPVPVLTANTQYPTAGDTLTLTTSATTGATVSRTISLNAPVSGAFSGQPAYPVGTTAPAIGNATTTTTTTLTGLQPGQTWLRLRAVGTSTVDTYLGIFTHPANNTDTGIQDATLVNYTNEGGASTPEAALNDALDTTYTQGPATPTSGDYCIDMWQPFGPGAITVTVRYRQVNDPSDTSSGLTWHFDIYKEDGTTLLQAFSWTSTAAQTGTWADQTCSLNSTALALIAASDNSDRRALSSKKWAVIT